jgi:propionyl-CoA synthetase
MTGRYTEVYERSIRDPEGFWAEAAEGISWERRWDRVRDTSRAPFIRWFPGGILNTCYNAVDRHIERGRGKQRALIYDSPVTGTTQSFTFVELRDRVAELAGALRALGVGKGDRVVIYMRPCPRRCSACSPARGSAPCTRSCSAGLRRRSWPPASTMRSPW